MNVHNTYMLVIFTLPRRPEGDRENVALYYYMHNESIVKCGIKCVMVINI